MSVAMGSQGMDLGEACVGTKKTFLVTKLVVGDLQVIKLINIVL